MRTVPLLSLLLSTLSSLAQPSPQLIGYRNIALTDSSRHYKPGTHPGDHFYYRPIEIDCWYPAAATPSVAAAPSSAATPSVAAAAPSAGTPPSIRFGEFLQLFEQRANRFQQDTTYTGLAAEMAQYLCAGLGIPDTARLTGLPTRSYRDAPGSTKPAPLILYLCSYNGMCYENIPLFESLAAHGYIVASITSVGRYPGNMTTDPADLLEQTADAAFALRYFRQSGEIDTTKPGVIGYSWGGLTAILFAMQTPTAAVLSLDGSEMHYYGSSTDEDSDFNRLRATSFFHPENLRAPYAYLESDNKQNDRPADSIFNPHPAKYWRFPGSTHEDFSGLPSLPTHANPTWLSFATGWFDHYIKAIPIQLPRDSAYPTVKTISQNSTTLRAQIIDSKDNTPLAFVNVGIPGKNLGTVTGEDGRFTLSPDPKWTNDSLAISMVGYQPRILPQKKLPKTISLRRSAATLNEVVVTSRPPKKKTLGNTTTSRFMSVGFPLRFLGAEIGSRIRLGKQPVRLKSFHCNVSDSRVDTALFRLNIYSFVNGTPQNILRQNIFLTVGKRTGDYTIDLTSQNLRLKGDILISLELIRGSPVTTVSGASPSAAPGALFFSASLLHSATWRRQTSQAEWKKAGGIGVGFNIEVQ